MRILNREWIAFSSEKSKDYTGAKKEVIQSDFLEGADKDTGEIILTYAPRGCWVNELDTGEYSLDFPEAGHVKQVGAPELVQEGLLVAVPRNAKIEAVDVINIEKIPYSRPIKIVSVPVPAKNTEPIEAIPDPAIYNSEESYPSTPVIHLGEEEFMGVYCTHLYVCPMQYQPLLQKLTLLSSITIRIRYRNTSGDNDAKYIFKGNPLLREFVLGCPSGMSENGKQRLIIITSNVLKGSMSDFQNARSNQYDTEEITVESIYSRYSQLGKAEAIRTYLMEEYIKKTIHMVILAGNVTEVPSYGGYGCMSDSYYAQTSAENYTPLFAISRFPAATATQLKKMSKYAAGYNSKKPNVRNNAIFIAYDYEDFINCSDEIVSQIDSRFKAIKRYDNEYGHFDVIRSINSGCGFINYRGHGDCNSWSTANAPLSADIPKLKVGGNAPHVLSIACLTNFIEENKCYGITWIQKQGAISFLGASRTSWRYQNNALDKFLWNFINSSKYPTIGEVYQAASCKLYINDKSKYSVENLQSYLMLGDATAAYGA